MVKNVATVTGGLLLIAGALGFIVPAFMGMHLSVAHNIVHLVSGVLALYFGLKEEPRSARTFCIVFGAVYALLGLAGFVATAADRVLTLIPGELVLGTADHVVHLVIGGVFLLAGLYRKHANARSVHQGL